VRDRSNKNLTVLQNYFLVNLHDWITDSQIDMANSSIVLANVIPFPMPKMKRACAYRKSHPAILMVQSAQDRTTDNASRVFGGARYRRVLVQ
jgi:hypothetical protein